MTEAYISRRRGEVDMPLKSLRHFAESLRLIRLELSSNDGPPESSLGAIISLAIHATLIGNLDESRIHLNALKHIIENRASGLNGLCADAPEVGNKVRRTDLDLALMAGTPTLFGSHSVSPAIPYVVPLNLRERNVSHE
ncbi:hypothetical protein NW762_012892 [Fusarium torreyae]|uniref:Uncharacterized protein n=1 Tax=Fusarium torreyae TaxID=1237075 RepID=A0A9W8V809_9HYPO|nr:hypothetical protein NW762_012892 [Fusarium torreyae]